MIEKDSDCGFTFVEFLWSNAEPSILGSLLASLCWRSGLSLFGGSPAARRWHSGIQYIATD